MENDTSDVVASSGLHVGWREGPITIYNIIAEKHVPVHSIITLEWIFQSNLTRSLYICIWLP